MMNCSRSLATAVPSVLAAALLSFVTVSAGLAQAQPADSASGAIVVPSAPTPTMDVEDVRIGMKGYGLTVFHGTEIEAFPVEVISVVSSHTPQRSAIWIRCPDPRMQLNGPVQGMSGSPIFLWEEGEEHNLGEGGRLVGAFAFGYSLMKDTLVGITPIKYMREVGTDAIEQADEESGASADARATVGALEQIAAGRNLSESQRLRLSGVQTLLKQFGGGAKAPAAKASPVAPLHEDGQIKPLLLPLSVGSPAIADAVSPLLAPLGISPVAAGAGSIAGPPPSASWAPAQLKPGSVLSVPLAFGDLDLSASGTVTEVMPDGTVLGFGHAMFGQGKLQLPMATGFVHFVIPRLSTSFKLGGSLAIAGSLVQDQATAVAGVSAETFKTAPVAITVNMPGQPKRTYNYQVVDHQQLTPVITSILAMQSLTAVHDLPPEHTIRLTGDLAFNDGHGIKLNGLVPGGGGPGVLMELMPPIAMAMQNPLQPLTLQGADLELTVEPRLDSGTLINVRLDQIQVAPGDTVGMTIWVQSHRGPVRPMRAELTVPANTPEGDYPLFVTGASSYLAQMVMTRPHLFTTRRIGELMTMLQEVLAIKADALYVTLHLPEQGIAVGRQELPNLPSSRRAMIFTPASTVATPFGETAEKIVPTDVVIEGEANFMLSVRKRPDTAIVSPPAGRATPSVTADPAEPAEPAQGESPDEPSPEPSPDPEPSPEPEPTP